MVWQMIYGDVNMKPKLLITIVCVAIIVSMAMITACFEKDVIEDVVGSPVETTPEPDPLPDGQGLAIGATAPEFSLPDADGNIVSLSDYAGQKLVIAFFATYG